MQIDKETLAMIVALAAVVGSVVSATVGAISVFLVTRLTKRYEDRKHLQELVINTAYKEWEYMANYLRSTQTGGHQLPLTDYIIVMSKYADMALDKNLTSETIESRLEEIGHMDMKIRAYRESRQKTWRSFMKVSVTPISNNFIRSRYELHRARLSLVIQSYLVYCRSKLVRLHRCGIS